MHEYFSVEHNSLSLVPKNVERSVKRVWLTSGVQCKQKETPNKSMDGQNQRTLRGLHQVYLKTIAHTFLSQFVGVTVNSLWSHDGAGLSVHDVSFSSQKHAKIIKIVVTWSFYH